MNRNAANAILKALEEPPEGAILMLLSASPGRLLPTIRSRCRMIDLPPLQDDWVSAFLIDEGVDRNTAETVAPFARGRPGYALQLAAYDGAEAISLSNMFLKAAADGGDISKVIGGVSGKAGEGRWSVFREIVLSSLANSARRTALGDPCEIFPNVTSSSLLAGWELLSALLARGEALNLDRAQLVNAMAYDLRAALRQEAA
jgi:DNA polymerase-3 subunit delta'